jgi:hypothetical protein
MTPMIRLFPILLLALGAASPGAAERRGDQYDALQARRAGQAMSLRDIENRILPRMGDADYLGPEFDHSMSVYRLKFMRSGRVFWLDVDARTGDVIGRSGR